MRVGSFRCAVCGEACGNTGRYMHYMRHVREGKMTRKLANSGRWEFYINGPNWRKADE